jgi:hypothetical protein
VLQPNASDCFVLLAILSYDSSKPVRLRFPCDSFKAIRQKIGQAGIYLTESKSSFLRASPF